MDNQPTITSGRGETWYKFCLRYSFIASTKYLTPMRQVEESEHGSMVEGRGGGKTVHDRGQQAVSLPPFYSSQATRLLDGATYTRIRLPNIHAQNHATPACELIQLSNTLNTISHAHDPATPQAPPGSPCRFSETFQIKTVTSTDLSPMPAEHRHHYDQQKKGTNYGRKKGIKGRQRLKSHLLHQFFVYQIHPINLPYSQA